MLILTILLVLLLVLGMVSDMEKPRRTRQNNYCKKNQKGFALYDLFGTWLWRSLFFIQSHSKKTNKKMSTAIKLQIKAMQENLSIADLFQEGEVTLPYFELRERALRGVWNGNQFNTALLDARRLHLRIE